MKNALVNVLILISVSMLTLVGCSSNTQSENTGVGAVAGAVIGGVAGSAFGAGTGRAVAVGVGAVAGALLGGWIGHSMDHSDNQSMCHTLDRNKTNQSSTWHNKKTGAQYTMTPTSKVMSYNGNNYCRQYETTATISGKTQTVTGTACRQSNGTWQTVS
jgi:surface antigen